jgi:hypothetical protein
MTQTGAAQSLQNAGLRHSFRFVFAAKGQLVTTRSSIVNGERYKIESMFRGLKNWKPSQHDMIDALTPSSSQYASLQL